MIIKYNKHIKATLSIKRNIKIEELNTNSSVVEFETVTENGKTILTNKQLGIKFSVKALGDIASINIIISDENRNVIVNYADEKLNATRCCVTCQGFTFCGDSACCEISPGSNQWLCC